MALAACGLALRAAAQTADPLTLSMEDLLHTDVVSAERFARQVTDAASAVSVLTAEDIRRYGWRTLGEVLDHMRGLYLTTGPDYIYLGSRGVGGLKTLSGRVLLLIDGVPANDNVFEQTFLGYDSQIDPALIARIEYAPGAGSALYGNNAFLGVIHVVTRRGRDVGGVEAAMGAGSHAERFARLTWGERADSGGEWLASLSVHRNDGVPGVDFDQRDAFGLRPADDLHLALKGSWNDWHLSLLGMTRTQRQAGRTVDEDQALDFTWQGSDRLALLSLSRDDAPAAQWRATQRLSLGRFAYRSAIDIGTDADPPLPGPGPVTSGIDGAWWLLDSQWTYGGLADHQLVLGARLRNDTLQKLWWGTPGDALHLQTRAFSVSAEDQYRLDAQWQATLGLRVERRSRQPTTLSPRAALVYAPAPEWTLKLSHGRAVRQLSVSETAFEPQARLPGEHVTITEAMGEYRGDGLRLLGSLYRYRLRSPADQEADPAQLRVRGLELEGEWLWRGWQLRASHAWQWPHAPGGAPVYDAPRRLGKLLLSAPLGAERWRASLALRHTGRYTSLYELADGSVVPFGIPARTVADLTLTALRLDGRWNLTLGVRNLLNAQNLDLTAGTPLPHRSRVVWLEVGAAWR